MFFTFVFLILYYIAGTDEIITYHSLRSAAVNENSPLADPNLHNVTDHGSVCFFTHTPTRSTVTRTRRTHTQAARVCAHLDW